MKQKNFVTLLLFTAGAILVAAISKAQPAPGDQPLKIGIYDSRSVAVAFAGSEAHQRWMAPLIEEHKKAKSAGDTKRVRELEAEGKARQKRAHTQAFATAPVDDILTRIKDKLPGIKSQAGVTVLVSKWDKGELAKHPSAEQVDVTLALIEAFNPTEKQRRSAIEIQEKQPISIQEVERIKD